MAQTRRERQEKRSSERVAAERLSTPDQLDQVIQVVRIPHWLALSALILVLAAAVSASVLIPMPITVRGEGILINVGGILTVTSDTEGRLVELLVRPGVQVRKGQVVARIDQPRLRQALGDREAELAEARQRRQKIERFHQRRSASQSQTLANQRRALEQRYGSATSHLLVLEEQLRVETDLAAQGILSRRQLSETRLEINEAKDELLEIESEIQRFQEILASSELAQERELLETQLAISDLERQVAALAAEARRSSEVLSPYRGRVVELTVNPGEIVDRHGPLFSLLPTADGSAELADELIAVLYVPPAEGKKVRPAMEVRLAPSSIKREEYGFMLGDVTAVAEVPSTLAGMMRVLKNRELVEDLSHDHAPFEVRVKLRRDAATRSGYRWSSSAGPDVAINVGTLCVGDVITSRERPITILLPVVGRLFDD